MCDRLVYRNEQRFSNAKEDALMRKQAMKWTLSVLTVAVLFGLCGCRTTGDQASASAVKGEVRTGYQPIQSEQIYSVNYDAESQILTVVLYEDGVYDYEAVPPEVYEGLLKAKDRDQYYQNTVRGGYKGKKFTME